MRTIDLLPFLWKVAYILILAGAAVGATLFPILYGSLVRWWETPMGQYMMFMGFTLALALDWVMVRIFIPATPIWVSFLLLTLIFVMVWWCTILFLVTYIRGRRAKRREDRQEKKK